MCVRARAEIGHFDATVAAKQQIGPFLITNKSSKQTDDKQREVSSHNVSVQHFLRVKILQGQQRLRNVHNNQTCNTKHEKTKLVARIFLRFWENAKSLHRVIQRSPTIFNSSDNTFESTTNIPPDVFHYKIHLLLLHNQLDKGHNVCVLQSFDFLFQQKKKKKQTSSKTTNLPKLSPANF
jgi:hypothetical protein